MAKDPPERVSVSIPPGSEISTEDIDELVENSECQNRSELIRELIAEANDNEGQN